MQVGKTMLGPSAGPLGTEMKRALSGSRQGVGRGTERVSAGRVSASNKQEAPLRDPQGTGEQRRVLCLVSEEAAPESCEAGVLM